MSAPRTRRRRRRPASRSPRGSEPRRWVGVAALLIVISAVLFATGIGGYLAENYIAPLYARVARDGLAGLFSADPAENQPPAGTPAETPGTSPGATPTPEARSEITVPGVPLYAIQLGAFSTLEAAEAEARSIQERGGAGYVLPDDGRYRVLAAAYQSEEDARSVRDNLKNVQGIDSYLYIADMPRLAWTVTSLPERKGQIEDALAAWSEAARGLMALSEDLDRNALTVRQVQDQLKKSAETLARHEQNLSAMRAAQGEHAQIDALHDVIAATSASFEGIIQFSSDSSVAISSKIKYDVIDTIVKYQTMLATP